ncbi:MAG: hypothetical protein WCK35_06835 [Chloroflexota bacterium]
MKKNIIVILVVLALLVSVFPTSSVFAKHGNGNKYTIEIRNRTGAPVSFILTDAKGLFSHLYTYEDGMWNITLGTGWYSYRANTACGAVSGMFNLDHRRTISFHCYSTGAHGSSYRQVRRSITISPPNYYAR